MCRVVPDESETEWQFDALDLRAVVRWLGQEANGAHAGSVAAVPAASRNQVDLYLDTKDRRFQRAGYSLRVRRAGRPRAAEATLKSLESVSVAHGGLRRRREVSERLERPDLVVLGRAEGAVGERVRAVAGRKRLAPLFEVRTRRRVFLLQRSGRECGEIALDETAIHPVSGETPARLSRVEVEVPEEAAATLEPFVERLRVACGLQPAGLSKYEAGLLVAGLPPPPIEDLGPTEIDPDQTIGEVALAVVRRHFGALLAREAGTRLGDDVEELHDMRVANRRLRASLALFADVLPAGVLALRDDLRWLGAALGGVRDLDVQLERLKELNAGADRSDADALRGLRLLLEDQRRSARASMLEALDSRRFALFVSRFRRTLRARHVRRSGPASLPARGVAPDLLEGRLRRFRNRAERIGPDSPASAYHRLRIDAKNLRYALEFLADVYPGGTRRPIERLVKLQDILGLHQDAEIAHERLRLLAREDGGELRADTIFAMGEIAERYWHSMAALRAEFPAAYARTKGKTWKAFLKRIEAERPRVDRRPAIVGHGDVEEHREGAAWWKSTSAVTRSPRSVPPGSPRGGRPDPAGRERLPDDGSNDL